MSGLKENLSSYETANPRTVLEEILSDEEISISAPSSIKEDDVNTEDVLSRSSSTITGFCVKSTHPTLIGRALIRFEVNKSASQCWLPMLHGISLRENDRVLVNKPLNSPEPVIIGVVDGFKKRPKIAKVHGPTVSLKQDESLKILSENGEKLLEVCHSESGPVIKLLQTDTNIDLPGELRINAKGIELNATAGQTKLSATDDIVVVGEMIKLNS